MYSIIYLDRVIAHTWFEPRIGDKWMGLEVYKVNHRAKYAKVR